MAGEVRVETIRLIGFSRPPGLVAAERQGFFDREDLDVEFTQTRGSIEQIRGLLAGRWDIAHTAVDNVLAYVNAENADLFVFFVGDLGVSQKVVARPEIKRLEDLRGKRLGLDALTTGYAFVLYAILAQHGVQPGAYETVALGGTSQRAQGLAQGLVEGALLSPPHDQIALSAGCQILTTAAESFPHHPGSTAATTRAWASAHHDTLVRYCRALLAGTRWAADPSNRERVVELLMEDEQCSREKAEALYEQEKADKEMVAPPVPVIRDAIQRVMAIRREMSQEPADRAMGASAERYFDPSFLLEADPSLA
jgi:ABC-type nitrate/sulfonate/bicarbonate transport system substrate-binding protein